MHDLAAGGALLKILKYFGFKLNLPILKPPRVRNTKL